MEIVQTRIVGSFQGWGILRDSFTGVSFVKPRFTSGYYIRLLQRLAVISPRRDWL